ncbi:beta-ketothiolase BktB [Granulosicoccus antarcticus]|uniref:Beta-ketothiolase BktB n=1 Tax=Granulosicoccus antarcticus IMCC3135 TaxID=1192854 RepID=A0A2Z2NYJ9_9GAMM|nr:beta-ketothiolase BktB [Granulosicoccus antarcticus]ASJ73930.1 Beta-ketothiolase BktB [Granulosicoccus antarcticus IMCC3135]
MIKKVYVVSAARTAIGTFSGSLATQAPTSLAAHVSKAAIERAGIAASEVQLAVFGHVINTEARDMYLSRVAAVEAGVPIESPAMNVNRLCGSGAQAIVSGLQSILLGDADIALVGGAECMSRGPHITQNIRHGQKMGDFAFSDMMLGALNDPFGNGHMGITAENIAEQQSLSRQDQDEFAVESHRRAVKAIADGVFKSQIVPVEIKTRKGTITFDTDEHVRADASVEGMGSLRAAFKKDGSVTAGNSSGINDGAAALILMSEEALARSGATPLAEITGYAHAGVEPHLMGLGPVPAVKLLSERTGISIADFDVVESNEAFAAQACAVTQLLGLDPAKVNPNGGAVALGHPVGATGAILTVKAIYELQRSQQTHGLITMCIGGGQGIALSVRRV